MACPHETQEDQFSHSGVSDEEVICEQSLEIHMATPQESQEDEIQMATPQETQEDQFPHSGVSEEEVISEQSPAATKVGENPAEQEDEEDEEESVSETPSQPKRRKRADGSLKQGVARIVRGETQEDLERYVSSLEFRSYKDNLNILHAQSVLTCVEGIPQQEMIQNIVSMTEKLKGDISHPFLQQIQLARQLESLSKIRDEHILNTAKWLVDEGMVSSQAV
ncbi:uncharacterized protein LOC110061613 [Orbicella faveolata]|uniref:uncharacterized protein LOC110061613 n=1 Tax=Orbicella faveolata TaxID=48498 RepID=UPI0009E5AD59|nr:uncharacterized protein LOC110061613 [Orbicella faveolata]